MTNNARRAVLNLSIFNDESRTWFKRVAAKYIRKGIIERWYLDVPTSDFIDFVVPCMRKDSSFNIQLNKALESYSGKNKDRVKEILEDCVCRELMDEAYEIYSRRNY